MNPGRILNIESQPNLHIRLDGERARLPEEDIARFEREMAAKINAQQFDQYEYLGLWSLLPAKVRTAIKRGST